MGRFTARPGLIAASAVLATLLGGALFWLAARIYDRRREARPGFAQITNDVSWFTPAAIIFGLLVYDPSIYFATHTLLVQGDDVPSAVIAGQAIAFALFLASMNIYRLVLRRLKGIEL